MGFAAEKRKFWTLCCVTWIVTSVITLVNCDVESLGKKTDELCPCLPMDKCPRVYGQSAMDIRELGFLEPCHEFGTVRCCGVAIRTEPEKDSERSYENVDSKILKPNTLNESDAESKSLNQKFGAGGVNSATDSPLDKVKPTRRRRKQFKPSTARPFPAYESIQSSAVESVPYSPVSNDASLNTVSILNISEVNSSQRLKAPGSFSFPTFSGTSKVRGQLQGIKITEIHAGKEESIASPREEPEKMDTVVKANFERTFANSNGDSTARQPVFHRAKKQPLVQVGISVEPPLAMTPPPSPFEMKPLEAQKEALVESSTDSAKIPTNTILDLQINVNEPPPPPPQPINVNEPPPPPPQPINVNEAPPPAPAPISPEPTSSVLEIQSAESKTSGLESSSSNVKNVLFKKFQNRNRPIKIHQATANAAELSGPADEITINFNSNDSEKEVPAFSSSSSENRIGTITDVEKSDAASPKLNEEVFPAAIKLRNPTLKRRTFQSKLSFVQPQVSSTQGPLAESAATTPVPPEAVAPIKIESDAPITSKLSKRIRFRPLTTATTMTTETPPTVVVIQASPLEQRREEFVKFQSLPLPSNPAILNSQNLEMTMTTNSEKPDNADADNLQLQAVRLNQFHPLESTTEMHAPIAEIRAPVPDNPEIELNLSSKPIEFDAPNYFTRPDNVQINIGTNIGKSSEEIPSEVNTNQPPVFENFQHISHAAELPPSNSDTQAQYQPNEPSQPLPSSTRAPPRGYFQRLRPGKAPGVNQEQKEQSLQTTTSAPRRNNLYRFPARSDTSKQGQVEKGSAEIRKPSHVNLQALNSKDGAIAENIGVSPVNPLRKYVDRLKSGGGQYTGHTTEENLTSTTTAAPRRKKVLRRRPVTVQNADVERNIQPATIPLVDTAKEYRQRLPLHRVSSSYVKSSKIQESVEPTTRASTRRFVQRLHASRTYSTPAYPSEESVSTSPSPSIEHTEKSIPGIRYPKYEGNADINNGYNPIEPTTTRTPTRKFVQRKYQSSAPEVFGDKRFPVTTPEPKREYVQQTYQPSAPELTEQEQFQGTTLAPEPEIVQRIYHSSAPELTEQEQLQGTTQHPMREYVQLLNPAVSFSETESSVRKEAEYTTEVPVGQHLQRFSSRGRRPRPTNDETNSNIDDASTTTTTPFSNWENSQRLNTPMEYEFGVRETTSSPPAPRRQYIQRVHQGRDQNFKNNDEDVQNVQTTTRATRRRLHQRFPVRESAPYDAANSESFTTTTQASRQRVRPVHRVYPIREESAIGSSDYVQEFQTTTSVPVTPREFAHRIRPSQIHYDDELIQSYQEPSPTTTPAPSDGDIRGPYKLSNAPAQGQTIEETTPIAQPVSRPHRIRPSQTRYDQQPISAYHEPSSTAAPAPIREYKRRPFENPKTSAHDQTEEEENPIAKIGSRFQTVRNRPSHNDQLFSSYQAPSPTPSAPTREYKRRPYENAKISAHDQTEEGENPIAEIGSQTLGSRPSQSHYDEQPFISYQGPSSTTTSAPTREYKRRPYENPKISAHDQTEEEVTPIVQRVSLPRRKSANPSISYTRVLEGHTSPKGITEPETIQNHSSRRFKLPLRLKSKIEQKAPSWEAMVPTTVRSYTEATQSSAEQGSLDNYDLILDKAVRNQLANVGPPREEDYSEATTTAPFPSIHIVLGQDQTLPGPEKVSVIFPEAKVEEETRVHVAFAEKAPPSPASDPLLPPIDNVNKLGGRTKYRRIRLENHPTTTSESTSSSTNVNTNIRTIVNSQKAEDLTTERSWSSQFPKVFDTASGLRGNRFPPTSESKRFKAQLSPVPPSSTTAPPSPNFHSNSPQATKFNFPPFKAHSMTRPDSTSNTDSQYPDSIQVNYWSTTEATATPPPAPTAGPTVRAPTTEDSYLSLVFQPTEAPTSSTTPMPQPQPTVFQGRKPASEPLLKSSGSHKPGRFSVPKTFQFGGGNEGLSTFDSGNLMKGAGSMESTGQSFLPDKSEAHSKLRENQATFPNAEQQTTFSKNKEVWTTFPGETNPLSHFSSAGSLPNNRQNSNFDAQFSSGPQNQVGGNGIKPNQPQHLHLQPNSTKIGNPKPIGTDLVEGGSESGTKSENIANSSPGQTYININSQFAHPIQPAHYPYDNRLNPASQALNSGNPGFLPNSNNLQQTHSVRLESPAQRPFQSNTPTKSEIQFPPKSYSPPPQRQLPPPMSTSGRFSAPQNFQNARPVELPKGKGVPGFVEQGGRIHPVMIHTEVLDKPELRPTSSIPQPMTNNQNFGFRPMGNAAGREQFRPPPNHAGSQIMTPAGQQHLWQGQRPLVQGHAPVQYSSNQFDPFRNSGSPVQFPTKTSPEYVKEYHQHHAISQEILAKLQSSVRTSRSANLTEDEILSLLENSSNAPSPSDAISSELFKKFEIVNPILDSIDVEKNNPTQAEGNAKPLESSAGENEQKDVISKGKDADADVAKNSNKIGNSQVKDAVKAEGTETFGESFKPPKTIQRGFLPILPYSENDPGLTMVKLNTNARTARLLVSS